MVQGFCMKCREQRDIKGAVQTKMANGRPAIRGTCVKCATKMFKIGTM